MPTTPERAPGRGRGSDGASRDRGGHRGLRVTGGARAERAGSTPRRSRSSTGTGCTRAAVRPRGPAAVRGRLLGAARARGRGPRSARVTSSTAGRRAVRAPPGWWTASRRRPEPPRRRIPSPTSFAARRPGQPVWGVRSRGRDVAGRRRAAGSCLAPRAHTSRPSRATGRVRERGRSAASSPSRLSTTRDGRAGLAALGALVGDGRARELVIARVGRLPVSGRPPGGPSSWAQAFVPAYRRPRPPTPAGSTVAVRRDGLPLR